MNEVISEIREVITSNYYFFGAIVTFIISLFEYIRDYKIVQKEDKEKTRFSAYLLCFLVLPVMWPLILILEILDIISKRSK